MGKFAKRAGICALVLLAAIGAAQAKPAAGAPAKHHAAALKAAAYIPNPCVYKDIDIGQFGLKPFEDAPVIRSGDDHVLRADLDVRYTEPTATTIAGCPVRLRTYNGALVGPTLRVKPGDTMEINLRNDLPGDSTPCHKAPKRMAMMAGMAMVPAPAVYNVTNLHTHGLHVSPSGNSDNVLLEICPTETKHFEIHIPKDHPPGTFWYHSHVHGSTALQVSSGMAGALIIEGGLDDVPEIKTAKEKTFLLQQITYDQNGVLEDYSNFGPGGWAATKRSVTVNSQIAPLITMQPGEVQRWRFIHGGVRESLLLYVATDKGTSGGALNEIATDGNALGRIDAWSSPLEMEPGYRSDVLFKAPALPPGQTSVRYYIFSTPILGARSLSFRADRRNPAAFTAALNTVQPKGVIAAIDVAGAPVNMPLPSAAELAPLAPYQPIKDSELTGEPQSVSFSIQSMDCSGPGGQCQPCPPGKTCVISFMVDHYEYPNSPVRQLKLGTASQWTIAVDPNSLAPEHPFHIHVNPFEMVRQGPDSSDETVWKDTLLIHQTTALKYRTLRSRYTDFDGKFVLHCHILDHEDGGMMQEVDIVK
jgi:FtsP/CotA-like multicopper oxidase with cupredoxin domain